MTKKNQDFEAFQNTDVILQVSVVDQDGNVFSLVGVSAIVWSLSRELGCDPVLITKTLGSGITVTDAAAGKLEIKIDAADNLILSGIFEHELTVTDSISDKSTVMVGTANILERNV